jgi:hypothetical protein
MSFMMKCTVDNHLMPGGRPSHLFDVHVEGGEPLVKAEYTIIADDEDEAAREGLKRFQKAYDLTPLPYIGDI